MNENTQEQPWKAGAQPLPFTETRFARKVWKSVALAAEYKKFTYIFGESQIGKTAALLEYARRHPEAVYVRMPTSPTLRLFAQALSDALGAPARLTYPQRRSFILSKVSPRNVLIVDEAHQCILTERTAANPAQMKIFEFLREIYDAAGCGVTICATNVFEREICNGALAGVHEQSRRRSITTQHCPATPSAGDLAKFAEAYGLPPADGEAKTLQSAVVRDERLGVWLTLLRMAAVIAAGKGRAPTWDDVAQAKAERDAFCARG